MRSGQTAQDVVSAAAFEARDSDPDAWLRDAVLDERRAHERWRRACFALAFEGAVGDVVVDAESALEEARLRVARTRAAAEVHGELREQQKRDRVADATRDRLATRDAEREAHARRVGSIR